ncbi:MULTISPECIES: hypothetical protein [unclassified Sphingobium]|uniref:hypothetical protein n=1 Tax=unclassified Sphingobium TaxID=2611147 RepID=UPI002224C187|nr:MULTISPECIES: hypothetical protein [unclassified Sphingobium]MCW2383530.1 hypothetical protein [Sphingobium sp. B2D3B]MCW2399495.1 hypothetical protein [Sphingobium sp. B2D3C]
MRTALAILALASLAACQSQPEDPDNGAQAGRNVAVPANDSADAANAAAEPAQAETLNQVGPIRIGATLAELAAEGLAVAGRDDPMPGSTCTYAHFKGWPEAAVMLDGDHVVRVDVSDAQHEGPFGLRVGQSEAEAIKRLGSAEVQPHPYTGPTGHYLVFHRDNAPTGLIAETDGKTVQSWRIGQWEQVQWVEGCS